MRNYFIYAGRDSRDFGVYISGQGTFGAPQKAYEFLSIPGRNGAVIGPERRLENATLTYECFIYKDFDTNIAAFRTFLLSLDGYQRLEDSYHPDEYRMAVYTGPFEPEVTSKNNAGSFSLVFSCKPQRFLLSGESEFTFDLLETSIVGQEVLVANPSLVGTARLESEVIPSAYPDWNDPSFFVGGQPDAPLTMPGLITRARLYIDDVSVFSQSIGAGDNGTASATIDYVNGSASITSLFIDMPDPDAWSYIGSNKFSAMYETVPALDSIKFCSHYQPVATTADLTGTTGKICVSGSNLVVYDPRFSTITSFRNWLSSKLSSFRMIGWLPTPRLTSFTPYVPTYPDEAFVIRASKVTGLAQFLTVPYASTDGMENPTMFPSKPLIRIYGNGTVDITGITITVTNVSSYVDVDCELMDCYEGSVNRNKDVSFSTYDFPVLSPGPNTVRIDSGPTSIVVTPRWFRV